MTKPSIRFRLDHPELQGALTKIADLVKAAGGRALLVGGSVRDMALWLPAKDLDIEVYGIPPTSLIELLSSHFSIDLVGQVFGVIKVQGLPIDVSLSRRETKAGMGHKGFQVLSDPGMTFQEAASRRDYTINALAYDLEKAEVLDPFGGLADLHAKVLRPVSGKFAEDPLRVLRGMQLAARFDLRAHPSTIPLARGLLKEYATLPVERVWGEWAKWAGRARTPSLGLAFLHACGWTAVYPELAALEGCPQDPEWHPEGDVWTHTLWVTDAAASIATRDGLSEEDRLILVLAALCHDLGKPATTTTSEGRIRSIGHTGRVEFIEQFLARLGAPPRLVERIVALSRQHLVHVGFAGSASHVRRLARTLGEAGENIQALARLVEADHSGRPPIPPGLPDNMAEMLRIARELEAEAAAPKPILLGRHLLELGMKPGPRMGEILRAAFEAQLDGAFGDLSGALEWLRRQPPGPMEEGRKSERQ